MILPTSRSSRPTRVRAAALGLTAIGLCAALAFPTAASATPREALPGDPTPVKVERIAGADRYDESALIARVVAPTTSPLVYLASGENFTDALSASAIAAQHGAPLLLTTSTTVPAVVAAEIARLNPTDVVVLGGDKTITPDVISQLQTILPGAIFTRIGGADRFEVSRNLITDKKFGATKSSGLFFASGRVFPDALSASPAALKRPTATDSPVPVLLVDGQAGKLTEAESNLILVRGSSKATVFGGTATFTAALEEEIKAKMATVERVAGADRYEVSANIGTAFFPAATPVDTVYLATGSNYPDALAGGVLAGRDGSPLFLAKESCVPQNVLDQISALKTKKVVLLGGPASLNAAVEALTPCAG